ncbi:MAG: cytochrome c peroxidase [Planctomycetota bacterium]
MLQPLRLLRWPAFLVLAAPFASTQNFPPPPAPLGPPPAPAGNPITQAKADLGKVLFWDEQLSSTRAVACGTCHQMSAAGHDPRLASQAADARHPGFDGLFGGADDVAGSPGVTRSDAAGLTLADDLFGMQRQVTRRRSMTVINSAYQSEFFWDGRAAHAFHDPITGALVLSSGAGLESLVAEPFISSIEMGSDGRTWQDVLDRIVASQPLALSPQIPGSLDAWIAGRDYPALFADAFGDPAITASRVCMAVATYMRTLVADQTPFDLWSQGNANAMTLAQKEGWGVFHDSFCASCHVPPKFTADNGLVPFLYTGVRPRGEDLGRAEVTGQVQDRGRMKIMDLRNVKLRAPYFHNGSKATLDDVVDFYEAGGEFEVGSNDVPPVFPSTGVDRSNLIDFLENGLTDARVEQGLPPFDHPALSEGTGRTPAAYGAGTPGSLGVAPRLHAFEPARLGATDFTVSLSGAPVGTHAALLLGLQQDLAGTAFLGANLHVVRTTGLLAFQRVHNTSSSGSAGGWGTLELSLPSSAAMAGTTLYAQWVVLDPHAGGSLAASEAVHFTLF